MGMFGGLINCVRTFGDQLINGIKSFSAGIRVPTTDTAHGSPQNLLSAVSETVNGVFLQEYVTNGGDKRILRVGVNCQGYSNYIDFNHTNVANGFEVTQNGGWNITGVTSSVTSGDYATFGWTNKKLIDKAVLYPDYSTQVETAITAQGDSYTALTDGFIQIKSSIDHNGYFSMTINGTRVFHFENISGAGVLDTVVSTLFPVQEGDVCVCDSLNQASNAKFFFYSNKGV